MSEKLEEMIIEISSVAINYNNTSDSSISSNRGVNELNEVNDFKPNITHIDFSKTGIKEYLENG